MILVHYKKIVNIFNYYASHSSYPRMDIEKIKEFIASADFSGTRKMEKTDIDTLIQATTTSSNKYKQNTV